MGISVSRMMISTMLLVSLTGCTPKAGSEAVVPPAAATAKKPPSATTPRSPSATPQVLPASARAFDESLLRGKEFLLSSGATKVALPAADNDLGDLARGNEAPVQAARALMDHLAQKSVPDGDLAPRWRAYLQARLSVWSKEDWSWGKARLAAPRYPEEGGVLLAFAVEGSSGRGRGSVYLSETPDHDWLIEDLTLEQVESPGIFNPEEVTIGPLVR